MKENATSLAMREVGGAVDRLTREVVRSRPEPEPRGYVSELERLPGLQLALRFCRDIGRGEALVSLFRRVPEEYVQREVGKVRCLCESEHAFGPALEQASCGRWFIGDASGVWALRLEEPEAAA